ncbi:helix-turn-helix domain-containing protein [Kitasatospora sp. NPDC058184]|uniref:helix-turn-helix domain-containing protein n=1 Tax=Kitasatospora sp. NPDC058184 TaxID=3346370 RepID=UPI0036DCB26F
MTPAVPQQPLAARSRFGADLRHRREAFGWTAEEVGARIGCSTSKVTRVETGKRSATPADFEALMDLFDVSESDRGHLEALFRRGRARTAMWWDAYADVLSSRYTEFISYEHEAVAAAEYQVAYIPALLQTEAYARAVTEVGFAALGPDQVDSLVEVKKMRQRRLRDEVPLRLTAVITQAALEFEVGGPSVQAAQLRHLRETADLESVDLRVVPFDKGAEGTLTGAFTLFQGDGQESPGTAFAEAVTGTIVVDDALGLRRLARLHSYLLRAALGPQESLALIAKIERRLTAS